MSDEQTMPEWPKEFRRGETVNEWKAAAYERARAEAAIARLHYAVQQFEQAALTFQQAHFPIAAGAMRNVIRDIGPLPPQQERG